MTDQQKYLEDPTIRQVIADVNSSHHSLPIDQVLAVLHEALRAAYTDRHEPVPHEEVRRIAHEISEGTWKQV
jgi:hypothetical protein